MHETYIIRYKRFTLLHYKQSRSILCNLPYTRNKSIKRLITMKKIHKILEEKILLLDGPMGTMIQKEKLKEDDFKGSRFINNKIPLKGNNDILNISKEKLIYEIHYKYESEY